MEESPTLRLKGYVDVMIVGMRYHYKSSYGQRLPNPMPGCPVSLQLEPSNPWDKNAIKVINEVNNRHLGYIIRETSKYLSPILQDNMFAAARGVLSTPRDPRCSSYVISCHVLLFFAGPPQLGPPLPPHLDFHEDLSSSFFKLFDTPVSFTGCTLEAYDSYIANYYLPHLQNPCQVEQTFLHPCSTNADSPLHVHNGDAIAPLDPPKFQTQSQTPTQAGTQFEVQGTVQATDPSFQTKAQCQISAAKRNGSVCMKCKQMGGGSFFQCAQSGCPVHIHESCMHAVDGRCCFFCLFLTLRGELLKGEKGSDSYKALKSRYLITRNYSIQFFGKKTFVRLRELAGLDTVLPTPMPVPCTVNTQCTTDGGDGEAVLTGTTGVEVAAKENKEKAMDGKSSRKEKLEETELVGHGNRRLPPRPSLLRACKRRWQHYDNLGHGMEAN